MGLREGLMIVGVVILLLIIADGIRRIRRTDAAAEDTMDDEERARQAQLKRELPAGGARVVKTHDVDVFDDDPIPVLLNEVALEPDHDALSDSRREQAAQQQSAAETTQPFDDYDPDFISDEDYFAPARPDAAPQHETARASDELAAEYDRQPDASLYDAPLSDDTSLSDNLPEADGVLPPEAAQEPAAESPEPVMADDETSDSLAPESEADPRPDTASPEAATESQGKDREHDDGGDTDDPVKAAALRIMGKHSQRPRPSERWQQEPEENPHQEISLAEQEFLKQQAEEDARQEALYQQQLHEEQEHQERLYQEQLYQERLRQEQEAEEALRREKAALPRSPISKEEEQQQLANADQMLVMHVKCKDSQGFHGEALAHILQQCGLQLGAMQVFHRFDTPDSGARIQFSVMSSIAPGIFDPLQLDELYVPSISLAMGLPAPGNSQDCFILMLETAKVVARYLNGDLRDESHSVMMQQTIEHYKQRIQEFERKQLSGRKR